MNNREMLALHKVKRRSGPAWFEEAMQLCQRSAPCLPAAPAFEDPTAALVASVLGHPPTAVVSQQG